MDDDEEVEQLCAEFGIHDADVEGDVSDDALLPRHGADDDWGEWEA